MKEDNTKSKELLTDIFGGENNAESRLFGGENGDRPTGYRGTADGARDTSGHSSVSRRNVLKVLGGTMGAAIVGVGTARASDGSRVLQVTQPSDLCGTVPTDQQVALIEDGDHKRGRGLYAGTSNEVWAFVGWLQQTRPEGTASGTLKPDKDASEPSHRCIQVWQPDDLKRHEPTDQHLAFVEDSSHSKGRGVYAGGSSGKWHFIGWLGQSEPSETAGGSLSPKDSASEPTERVVQVYKPKHLRDYDPTDYHLAFIEKGDHEKGRGFYAGGSDGEWYFIGWLAQSQPSGTASDTVDPNGSECGGDSTSDDSSTSTSGTSNYVFVTESELQTQRKRVNDGKEPWKTAYDNLISDADSALTVTLKSVTDDDGDHTFKRTSDSHDYSAAIDMGDWARDCALAYWFTGADKYADRAVEIIHHWCLNDSSYMIPTTNTVNNGNTIRQHITMPNFTYAASFLRGHSAWSDYDSSRPWDGGSSSDAEAAFEQWVSDRQATFVDTEPSYCVYDNHWAWRIVDRAATAAYLQSDSQMSTAKGMWKAQERLCDDGTKRPWNDFVNNYRDSRAYDGSADPGANGVFKHELGRSNGYLYTQFNIKGMTMPLLIFERYDGTDLWEFNAPSDDKSGSSMDKTYNWLGEYVQDTSAWKWNDSGVSVGDFEVEQACSTYEHAYAHWGDSEYRKALTDPDRIGGRPHYDYWLLGHVTLTHGAQ